MSLSRSLCLFIGVVLHFVSTGYAQEAYTGEVPPVEVGASCYETTVYHWTTESKSEWRPTVLLAVPEAYSPGEWEGTEAFVDVYRGMVEGNHQVSNMADALMILWQQSPSLLYGEFERSITVESRQVQCSGGIWTTTSNSMATKTQNSEWIGISDEAQDRRIITVETIVQILEAKLGYINSQPGTDPRPHHSYTVTTQ